MSEQPSVTYSEADKARFQRMRQGVKQDLALKGYTSADLAGLESDDRIENGHIVCFALRVLLHGGRSPHMYTMVNADGAVIECDGIALKNTEVQ